MMPEHYPRVGDAAHLIVLAPDAYRGRRIPLVKDELIVGREVHCDVRFDDPYLSRCHAVLRRHGGTVYVQDLYSRAGTLVNGTVVIDAQPLHPGDIVSLADLRLRYETAAGTDTRHEPGDQPAGVIERMERDQYAAYLQRREQLLRRVGATRTGAQWLTWLGFGCFVAGLGLFAAGVLEFISQLTGGEASGDPRAPDDILGRDVAGIPAGWLGGALAAVGLLLVVVAILLRTRATARRNRVDEEFPDLPPGQLPPGAPPAGQLPAGQLPPGQPPPD